MPEYPKFLFCQNELHSTDDYVLHTEIPRFLARKVYHPEHCMFDITWVDKPAYDQEYLIALMQELKDWYGSYQQYLTGNPVTL